MFSIKDKSVSDQCWSTIKCILNIPSSNSVFCHENCIDDECAEIIEKTCPPMLYFPHLPIFFGDVYLAYKKSHIPHLLDLKLRFPYLCYNHSRYDDYFVDAPKIFFNDTKCFIVQNIRSPLEPSNSWIKVYRPPLEELYRKLKKYNTIINYTAAFCTKPKMYQCLNSSVCISIYRLMDKTDDCPHKDDENGNRQVKHGKNQHGMISTE